MDAEGRRLRRRNKRQKGLDSTIYRLQNSDYQRSREGQHPARHVMKKVPRISETEWQIMKIVWSKGQCTANEILESLNAREPWHPKTARTLIGRLVKKRALGFREDGRAYIYRPCISEEEAVAHYSDSFLERVFDGALAPMLAHYVQSRQLSASDLKQLREVLDGSD